MWWLPLAMAAGKSVLDEQNRKQDIASNVITQKYSPWTGARADFSAQGQNQTGNNLLKGAAGAMMDYKAGKMAEEAQVAAKSAQDKADGDWYAQNGASIGGKSPAAVAKSAFSSPTRAPATVSAPTPEIPMQAPSENPWLAMAKRPLLPMEAAIPDAPVAPKADPTSGNRQAMIDALWGITPQNAPFKGSFR